MHQRRLWILAATALLVLAACSGGGATAAPSSAPSAAPSVEASAPAASEPAATEPPTGGACAPSTEAGDVEVSIEGFQFSPASIEASTGQTITFTNGDSAPHSATLDDDSCATPNLGGGESGGLTFTAAGTYPFHCRVHPDMRGTITVS